MPASRGRTSTGYCPAGPSPAALAWVGSVMAPFGEPRLEKPPCRFVRLGRESDGGFAWLSHCAQTTAVKLLDQNTERAVRSLLARFPAEVRLEYALLYGSRARGEDRPDSDADLALIIAEGTADWHLVGALAELAYDVFLESGILIQPVPISLTHWLHPERFPRPGFLRNVAREGIVL